MSTLAVQQAHAAIVAAEVRLIEARNTEMDALGEVVAEHIDEYVLPGDFGCITDATDSSGRKRAA